MYKALGLALACALFVNGQPVPNLGMSPRVIVTVGHYYGPERQTLTREDFSLSRDLEKLPITNVIPLRGDRAALELYLLVDNCSNCEQGSNFDEIRRFILAQPTSTSIGVAYILNGRLEIGVNPTKDRKKTLASLSTPQGSIPSSPFTVLSKLIESWPRTDARRVVVMMSNGVNPAVANTETQDSSTEAAIAAAQKAEISVYTIYHPAADFRTTDLTKMYTGQVQLAHLAFETGGEGYYLSFGPLPSLAPFLSDISNHMANQYLVEFLALPRSGTGSLDQITVKGNIDVTLMAPDKVWIPAPEKVPSKTRTGSERLQKGRL